MREVGPVRMTPARVTVLAILTEAGGTKLSVESIVRRAGLSGQAVRAALRVLHGALLVRRILQTEVPDRPPHMLWWATRAGIEVSRGR